MSQLHKIRLSAIGEACEEYWQRTNTAKFCKTVSKYNSEQTEKPGIVSCSCCSKQVPGKIIDWGQVNYLRQQIVETVPEWSQCEQCKKFLSHVEEERKNELLHMCTDCFSETIPIAKKSQNFSKKRGKKN